MAPIEIGMLVFPGVTLLDLVGPLEVFGKMQNANVRVLWKKIEPISTDTRSLVGSMNVLPTGTLKDCPPLDVIFVPGGPGQTDIMLDDEVLNFVREQGQNAKWVTSVCTGSLVLGAAGLLDGYKAGCHWMSRDQLSLFGSIPTNERVVIDRNRVTGGGVTAGIDFAFTLVAEMFGVEMAQRLMLVVEYAPAPPFPGGTPETSPAGMADSILERAAGVLQKRFEVSTEAARRLGRDV